MVFGISEPPLNPPVKGESAGVVVRAYTRIVMSPSHFRRFIEVGTDLLKKYETAHGKIPTEETKKKKSRKH